MEDSTKPVIQAALNGNHTKARHAATPQSIDELIRDAVACVAVGAGAIHLHPYDLHGRESLDASVVDEVVMRVRDAAGVPVGISTGAWIEPDLDHRLAMVRAWRAADYASVNLSEAGSDRVMEALIEAGVGIEAGAGTVEDADRLAASGFSGQLTRVLVEPDEEQVGNDAIAILKLVDDIHRRLDHHGVTAPRLQHTNGGVTWVVIADAIRRGLDFRVGLEDTIYDPNGERTTGNAALIRAASRMRAEAAD